MHSRWFILLPHKKSPCNPHGLQGDELSIRLKSGYTFTTYIVKTQLTDINTLALKELKKEFDVFLHHYHLSSFYIQMHAVYHVFHILGESVPSSTALE